MTRKNAKVDAAVAEATADALACAVWNAANFSQHWYADALREGREGEDYHALRREIVFATCFAESYIFEWARNIVGVEAINDYFPPQPRLKHDPRYRRKLRKKWREVPTELQADGKIHIAPKLNLSMLGMLIKYRNGLVHAAASRPTTDSLPAEAKPYPAIEELRKLNHGWAVKIVADLVVELHRQLGTSPPAYVKYP